MRIYGARPSSYRPQFGGYAGDLPSPASEIDLRPQCSYVRNQFDDRCVGETKSGLHWLATGGQAGHLSDLGIWTAARARERIRSTDPIPDRGVDPADADEAAVVTGVRLRDARDDDPAQDTNLSTLEDVVAEYSHRYQPEDIGLIADGDADTVKAYLTLGAQRTDGTRIGCGFAMQLDDSYEALGPSNPVWRGMQGPSRGGHMQVCCGYVMYGGELCMVVWNSWGTGFGLGGFALIPVPIFAQTATNITATLRAPNLVVPA